MTRRRTADGPADEKRRGPQRTEARPARSRGAAAVPPAGAETDLSTARIETIQLAGLPPQAKISPNFRLYELTRSEIADRNGIDNRLPSDHELHAAVYAAREVLERIRAEFGSFTPNSVFRGHPLERALKNKPSTWISTSQHTKGEACDVEITGVTTLDLAKWAANHLPNYDQIICECFDPAKGANSGWVHISLVMPGRGVNRRKLLSYIKDPASGRWVYVDGLRATVS